MLGWGIRVFDIGTEVLDSCVGVYRSSVLVIADFFARRCPCLAIETQFRVKEKGRVSLRFLVAVD